MSVLVQETLTKRKKPLEDLPPVSETSAQLIARLRSGEVQVIEQDKPRLTPEDVMSWFDFGTLQQYLKDAGYSPQESLRRLALLASGNYPGVKPSAATMMRADMEIWKRMLMAAHCSGLFINMQANIDQDGRLGVTASAKRLAEATDASHLMRILHGPMAGAVRPLTGQALESGFNHPYKQAEPKPPTVAPPENPDVQDDSARRGAEAAVASAVSGPIDPDDPDEYLRRVRQAAQREVDYLAKGGPRADLDAVWGRLYAQRPVDCAAPGDESSAEPPDGG